MSRTPQYDAKIKVVLDATQPGERICSRTGEKWMLTEREIEWCRKFNSPPSRYSPRTRVLWLSGFRTAFEIFWNKHALTDEPILSYIHPDNPIRVVSDLEWHAMDIGSMPEYQHRADFTQPFFDQFESLLRKVPMGARREWRNVVNTIGVGMWDVEDCYLVFSTVNVKRAMYTYYCLENSEDTVQATYVNAAVNCFGSARIDRCHSCRIALESRDCMSCTFVFDCRNCEFCFCSTNLRNRKYMFLNEQLSEEEWKKRIAAIDLSRRSTFEQWERTFRERIEASVFPENFNVNAADSTGEYLFNCVRCTDCYYTRNATDCDHIYGSETAEQCAYVVGAYPATNCWMSTMLNQCDRTIYSMTCSRSQNLEYCFNCHECENCFGCIGLRDKKFHIFNMPYAEDEYWRKLDEIKCAMLERGEYGEFFPLRMSPTGMSFSVAAAFFDVTAEDYERFAAPVFDPDKGVVLAPKKVSEAVPARIEDVPDALADIGPEWVGRIFVDEAVRRRWAVVPKEMEYYRSHQLPFPKEHYSSRLRRQLSMLNMPEVEDKPCVVCAKPLRVYKNRSFPARRLHCMACYLAYLEKNG